MPAHRLRAGLDDLSRQTASRSGLGSPEPPSRDGQARSRRSSSQSLFETPCQLNLSLADFLLSCRLSSYGQARLESTQLEKTNLAQQAHQKALNLEQKVKEHKRLQSSRQAELAAASTATDEHSSADNLTEITFPSSSSTYGNGNSNGGGAGGIEGTFRLFGGVREKLWTVYLAIPVPTKIANSSSSSSLADLAGSSSSLSHPLYSVTLIDFPTPYYSASQGAQKLAALAETMRKKLLGFRGDGVVPILSVMLVDRPGKGGKRLGLLTGRVGRGERLRGVLKVCGRLEMGVAKVSLSSRRSRPNIRADPRLVPSGSSHSSSRWSRSNEEGGNYSRRFVFGFGLRFPSVRRGLD